MEPTIEDGQTVPVVQYGDSLPQRGDVIVFRPPTAPDREFVKRVIGLPGDTIEIGDGGVLVNGDLLSEPYVSGITSCFTTCDFHVPPEGSDASRAACGTMPGPDQNRVPGSERCYFVLGDNRPNSSDSRQGWLVLAENIVGRVDVD